MRARTRRAPAAARAKVCTTRLGGKPRRRTQPSSSICVISRRRKSPKRDSNPRSSARRCVSTMTRATIASGSASETGPRPERVAANAFQALGPAKRVSCARTPKPASSSADTASGRGMSHAAGGLRCARHWTGLDAPKALILEGARWVGSAPPARYSQGVALPVGVRAVAPSQHRRVPVLEVLGAQQRFIHLNAKTRLVRHDEGGANKTRRDREQIRLDRWRRTE